jgi:hypothetical protein
MSLVTLELLDLTPWDVEANLVEAVVAPPTALNAMLEAAGHDPAFVSSILLADGTRLDVTGPVSTNETLIAAAQSSGGTGTYEGFATLDGSSGTGVAVSRNHNIAAVSYVAAGQYEIDVTPLLALGGYVDLAECAVGVSVTAVDQGFSIEAMYIETTGTTITAILRTGATGFDGVCSVRIVIGPLAE